jgi:hypothetical protein
MANEADFYIKAGDVNPPLRAVILEDDLSVPTLDTALVRFKSKEVGADSITTDARAVVVNPSEGYVRYDWDSSDTSDAGYYNAVLRVDYDGVNEILDESITYSSGTDVYALTNDDVLVEGHHTVDIEDASGDTYDRGTDFEVIDDDGDDSLDSIDWSIGGSSPDDAEDFFVDYSYASVFTADETFPNEQYIVVKIDEPL